MGAPVSGMQPAGDAAAETLLSSLKTIAPSERRKHASVLNYWLSIRGDGQFPAIRDLDPLEISDAGPFSVLLEMIGGGEDAEIRHLGQAIKGGVEVERIGEAPAQSLLSCIANKLPIVASSREAFAFEDEFKTPDGKTRCWATLLPFSATGTWIDFVYGFVSLDPPPGGIEQAVEPEPVPVEMDEAPEPQPAPVEKDEAPEPEPVVAEVAIEPAAGPAETAAEPEPEQPRPESPCEEAEAVDEPEPAPPPTDDSPAGRPGFSAKLFDSLSAISGFYGANVKAEPNIGSLPADDPAPAEPKIDSLPADDPAPAEPKIDSLPADDPAPAEPTCATEGPLQSKLAEVRAKADEARMAKLRSNAALYEGLGAAYDFALDAEEQPEEYLRLVEAQGLKIQLRSPMKPVVKLAFDGMCDDSTIGQLEAVLAWALKMELPRGSLAARIESEGGIAAILGGGSRAA